MSTCKSVNSELLLYTNTNSEWSVDKPEGKSQHCNTVTSEIPGENLHGPWVADSCGGPEARCVKGRADAVGILQSSNVCVVSICR